MQATRTSLTHRVPTLEKHATMQDFMHISTVHFGAPCNMQGHHAHIERQPRGTLQTCKDLMHTSTGHLEEPCHMQRLHDFMHTASAYVEAMQRLREEPCHMQRLHAHSKCILRSNAETARTSSTP